MFSPGISDSPNLLLPLLSEPDIGLLGPFERITFELNDIFESAQSRIDFVYFIESGVASVIAELAGTTALEVGVIGKEGMTAHAVLHGDDQAAFLVTAQVAGSALRIPVAQLRNGLEQSRSLRVLLTRYTWAFSIQVASTVLANGRLTLERRLARWLLMTADRCGSRFNTTHEFLSIMLGVRRPGVTVALQELEGRGLILSTRGTVDIRDREGLIEAAGGAYGLAEREYARLLVPARQDEVVWA